MPELFLLTPSAYLFSFALLTFLLSPSAYLLTHFVLSCYRLCIRKSTETRTPNPEIRKMPQECTTAYLSQVDELLVL